MGNGARSASLRRLAASAVLAPVLGLALHSGPTVTAARAEVWLPLAPGNTWSYVATDGRHETQTVTGTTTVFGRTYAVITYTNSSDNEGLENYWSTDAEGDVFLGGFFRSNENLGVRYDPPVLFVDAPLSLGKQWTSHVDYYEGGVDTPSGSLDLSFAALEAPTLTLPAGTFPTFGIGQLPSQPLPAGALPAALAGRTIAMDGTVQSASAVPTEWYAAGIGLVQYDVSLIYQLASYGLPTPVAARSWGAVKAAYR